MNQTKFKIWLPFILGIVLAVGLFLGSKLTPAPETNGYNKLSDVLSYVKQEYVDTINSKTLVDGTIEKMLENLDPHSAYIPAEDLAAANETLEGNFEGVGIEFHIQLDTIMVVAALSGGPSEAVGIMAGDRIIKVDGKNKAGIHITNEQVLKTLRGKGGTKVKVEILRRGENKLREFIITRGKIPIYSVDVAYMVDDKTGYIKISRFAATTYKEYLDAFDKLNKKGMSQLILDLRGNPGGYLDASTHLADEFLDGKKLIVYTKGKSRPRTDYYADKSGGFEKGKLVVLIDEGSASASEILSGALQDWDRATIIGRRSFGKGLVQEQTVFPDGSALRLTIARYYTPTGRSIQKSYKNGVEAYNDELMERIKHGELESADSIHIIDSLKFKTPGGKIVYGGGGIIPDVFVPLDTNYNSDYLNKIFGAGLLSQFAYDFVDDNRAMFKNYKDFDAFNKSFVVNDATLKKFIAYAERKSVKYDEKGFQHSKQLIQVQLKAFIARLLWQNNGLFPVLHTMDKTFAKAIEVINK